MTHHLPFPVFDGFSAEASLYLATDSRVDPQHLSMAYAYDLKAPRQAPCHARIGKVTLKPAAIVRIMAAAIEKAAVRSGTVYRADFRQLGLRDDEIDRHFQEAFLRASQRRPALFSCSEAA